MAIARTIARSIVALSIAVAPLASGTFVVTGAAYAKDGNGNSGGGGGGGNGNGNGGGHGGNGGSNHGKSGDARSDKSGKASRANGTPTLKSLFTFGKKSEKATSSDKAPKTAKAKTNTADSNTAGIRSLNRNYHAYLNSNDPRMAAISAYAIAYAEFEAENGTDVIPTDPALSDDALRDALASFTKDGVVTDDTLETAKDILGVGPAVGKIDQIRDTLPETAAETDSPELDTAN
ncbi:hypothetical protein OE766_23370 [Pararhizobium sp. YC-54]|uniref:hypothetical protein n=1 Tax=Pararhizobium sp. YC-54 TaxID=2986920 RepID=UPI0021F796B0|nr:hypothetical protein [Pararhizobium sp. YC-54]MCW0001164.1 hypothetical protein [Pararhizobium sp. YC-54]